MVSPGGSEVARAIDRAQSSPVHRRALNDQRAGIVDQTLDLQRYLAARCDPAIDLARLQGGNQRQKSGPAEKAGEDESGGPDFRTSACHRHSMSPSPMIDGGCRCL